MRELRGNYKSDFDAVKKYIEKNAAKGREREEAIESLRAIYLSAMTSGESIFEIHENSPKEYAEEICESLPAKKAGYKKWIIAVSAVLVIGIIAAAVLLGFGEKDDSDIYEVSHQVFTPDIGPVIYSKEGGIRTTATFVNTSENKIWLSSNLWLERFDGENWVKVNADVPNSGTVMVMPHESVTFCTGVGAERIYENIVPGDYRIVREMYVDEELSVSGGYAEHWFSIEAEIIPAEEYHGMAIEGFGMDGSLPEWNNMPGEVVFDDPNQKEYCENLIDEIYPETVEEFYIVFVPSDETTYGEITYSDMERMLDILKDMEFTPCEAKNPNTGGGTSIYIVTTEGKIGIHNNGGFIAVEKENDTKAYAFDSAPSEKWFGEAEKIAWEIIEENRTKPERNPQPENTSDKKEEINYIIPDEVEYFATLFCNDSKTAVQTNMTDELREILTHQNLKEEDSSSLGNRISKVDTIEFIREDDGTKYALELYEKGFILKGSAVPEEEQGKICIVDTNKWKEFKHIIADGFENADYEMPYWFGLISLKRVEEIVVFGENGEKYRYTQKDDCFDNFFAIFRARIKVSSLKERFEGNKLPDSVSEKYIIIKIYFETGTIYEIIAEQDYITMVSSDVNYGLRYNLAENADAYDAFLDYAEGGPINAVTG